MHDLIGEFGESRVFYFLFGILLGISLTLDIAILQRSNRAMSVKSALAQTAFWISIALGYGYLVYHFYGYENGLQYFSAYLMEYSLSADNLFVFILILSYFKISDQYYHKVLFYGIIGAVVFRVIFILLGIVIVEKFHWVLYIFGVILIYTGFRILISGGDSHFDPKKNMMYKFISRYFPLLESERGASLVVMENGKKYYTILFLVITIIASADLVFALDSIPAVFAISQETLVIITSNIFAVMGLRAMFFLLKNMADKFVYLQQGVSIVLMFIGVKMLLEIFTIKIPSVLSLAVIASIIFIAILLSIFFGKRRNPA